MESKTELPNPARRVVLMVRELHRLGYARLRLVPGMAPSGMYWRGSVTYASNTRESHGAMVRQQEHIARYTTGQEKRIFGWQDAEIDTPAESAAKFIERFPNIAALGRGEDPDYARWYSEMVEATEPAGLIYAYSDWDDSSLDFLRSYFKSPVS
jgi:hypothetical protein